MERGFKDVQKRLGERLRARRESLGLSQEDLALEADVDRTYVSMIERGLGNVSLKVLYQLATILKIDVKALL
jgi:transcriptional regulator with XRE-family HTH domain